MRKRERQGRQSVFGTDLIDPFGKDPEEELRNFDY